MRIAVQYSRLAVRRAVGLQPVREIGHRQRLRLIPVVPVAFEQPEELRNLALQKGSRPFELSERLALPCDVAQLREARGVGQADLVPHARVAHIRLGHLAARIEAVDLFHEVEHHPEHV